MKTLIVYASKYGCTEKCVKYLESKVDGTVEIVNLKRDRVKDLQSYGRVIIGSPIYMSSVLKVVKKFSEQYLEELLKKEVILFVSCTTPSQLKDYFDNNFPKELLLHAEEKINFGGELNLKAMSFIDRNLVKMAEKLEPREMGIIYENIDNMRKILS